MSYKYNTEDFTMWRTVEDAAKHFGISKTTMYKWIKKEKIRATVSRMGGCYLVDVNSVEQ